MRTSLRPARTRWPGSRARAAGLVTHEGGSCAGSRRSWPMASALFRARRSPALKPGRKKADFGLVPGVLGESMLDQGLIAKAAARLEPLPPTVNRLATAIARDDGGLG